jgi:hypothetical protein
MHTWTTPTDWPGDVHVVFTIEAGRPCNLSYSQVYQRVGDIVEHALGVGISEYTVVQSIESVQKNPGVWISTLTVGVDLHGPDALRALREYDDGVLAEELIRKIKRMIEKQYARV